MDSRIVITTKYSRIATKTTLNEVDITAVIYLNTLDT